MKVLVTGGAGFIGLHIARCYLRSGKQVVVLDNMQRHGGEENLKVLRQEKGKLKVVRMDIRDGKRLTKAVKGVDAVFHMAGQVAVTTSIENPKEDFETNALGTLNVLEVIRQSKKRPVLLFASTNKVYGKMEKVKVVRRKKRYAYKKRTGISEKQPLDFHSPYGCSKGAADQYVRDYARIYGLSTVVFRQSCIYGEHQFGVEDQGWVAWFCIAAVLERPITIYGDGRQVRDILYIEDLVRAFDLAQKHIHKTKGGVYNIGGGPKNTLSLLELHALLEKKLKKKIPLHFAPWRPGDQKVYVSDIRKAKKDFGWEPKISVEEGVDHLLEWVQKNRKVIQQCLS